jgi:hypothetical protein
MDLHKDPIDCTAAERADAFLRIGQRPLWVLRHKGRTTGDQIIDTIRYGIRRFGIRHWLVDHLGYLYDPTDDDRRGEVDRLVRTLHVVGLDDGASIHLIAHPNRANVARRDRVRIRDLKESSAIEQDAAGGMVAVRMAPKNGQLSTTIHVDKLRGNYGVVGSKVELFYDRDACLFADRWEVLPCAKRLARLSAKPAKPDHTDAEGDLLPY